MDKGERPKDISTRFPTISPKIVAVRPEHPREFQEEEGSGERPRIVSATTCERSEEEPSTRLP